MTSAINHTVPVDFAGEDLASVGSVTDTEESISTKPLVKRPSGRTRKLFVQLGQRFGRGIVIDPEIRINFPSSRYPYWGARLLCDCGKEYKATVHNLLDGGTVSCGCQKSRFQDLTGMRFGMLVAIERAPNDSHGKTRWLFECDCGTRKTMSPYHVKTGKVSTCGCVSRAARIRPGTARRDVLRTYKNAAANRDFVWEIDHLFDQLTSGPCEYCGSPPSRVAQSKAGEIFVWNGIDRKDNALGYTANNVVTCCKQCNFAKGTMSFDEFMAWIKRVATYSGFIQPQCTLRGEAG